MPDYLFTQFESIFFLANQRTISFESERRKKKISAPEDYSVDPLAITVCKDFWKVVCEHPSRHYPETNHRSSIFMPQYWSLKIVTTCTTSRKALRLIVRLPAIFNHSVRFFLTYFDHIFFVIFIKKRTYSIRSILRLTKSISVST